MCHTSQKKAPKETAKDKDSALQVVFCRELGVAIEKIKDGFTLESLWSVLPPEPNKKALLE